MSDLVRNTVDAIESRWQAIGSLQNLSLADDAREMVSAMQAARDIRTLAGLCRMLQASDERHYRALGVLAKIIEERDNLNDEDLAQLSGLDLDELNLARKDAERVRSA